MKRAMAGLIMGAAVILAMTVGTAWSEEAAWYDVAEDWIVRVYTAPSAPDVAAGENFTVAGYSVMLEVVDTGNNLVTGPIVGMATNPMQITGAAEGPEVSLAFDEASETAYVIYTAGSGEVTLQSVPDIKRVGSIMEATPNPVMFGKVTVGSTVKRTITITNTGVTPLNITAIGTTGDPFKIMTGSTCAVGTPVAGGGSCTIVVKFIPTVVDSYNGSFVVSSDGGNVAIKLIGTGVPL